MTGKSYDQMLRDADPYRSGLAVAPDEELLGQILAEPQTPRTFYRLAVVGVAAAVLVAAVGVAVALNRTSAAPPVPAAPSAVPSSAVPTEAVPSQAAPPASSSLLEPEKVQKAAQEGPRFVFGEPGWKIIHLEPFGDHMGEMAWEKGDRMINSSWFPKKEYDGRRSDKDKSAEKVKVGDQTGWIVTLGLGQDRVTTEPRPGDGVFATIDGGPGFTRAQFKAFLAETRVVSVEEWIAEANGTVTREGEAGDRAARIFAEGDLPGPPQNWDHDVVRTITTGDAVAFDTTLTKLTTCAWLAEWNKGGAARTEAGKVLKNSRNWPLLTDLESRGSDLRKTITRITDDVVNGGATEAEVEAYRKSLC
ncbi:hypothetical protein JIG36_22350 [Actinoplanes sp. LDG1-06]|uniref:Uncharacterized protein n=1 Tax=Paractinoplanes ovalisporus TaxID=2810368 RepID=A0ABS2AGC3_9ACTN|nr:hypothetical protein [Actinoplanes ovalisporus]MBM2618306.1 hypothetical protein [Actinoplanes ovalisporus]